MKNRYEIEGDVTKIFIVRRSGDEYVTLIDTDDLVRINTVGLSLGINYSHGILPYVRFSYKLGYLHRFIMQPPPYMEVDHIDGNPLNNRKSNLRVVTQMQNMQNQRDMPGKTRGVHKTKDNKYIAQVMVNGHTKYLGIYASRGHAVAVVRSYRSMHVKHSEMDKEAPFINPTLKEYVGYSAYYTKEKKSNHWRAMASINGRSIHVGYYATKEEALEAAALYREIYLKEHL